MKLLPLKYNLIWHQHMRLGCFFLTKWWFWGILTLIKKWSRSINFNSHKPTFIITTRYSETSSTAWAKTSMALFAAQIHSGSYFQLNRFCIENTAPQRVFLRSSSFCRNVNNSSTQSISAYHLRTFVITEFQSAFAYWIFVLTQSKNCHQRHGLH